ncbi:MAG TPA: cupin domain-containing protein [Bryobacteraceae bacterium]|jgi:quercetin dioxygenase-like cupin family protein
MWTPPIHKSTIAFHLAFVFIASAIAQEYKEYPANRISGVNVDQFIGYWDHSETTVTHGALIERVILRTGDPERPGPPGSVLEFHKKISLASLDAGMRTSLTRHPEQEILYIEQGTGELRSESLQWPLREGIAVLIPPNIEHELYNTGEGRMEMVLVTAVYDHSVKLRNNILVRDRRTLPFAEAASVWNYDVQCLFGPPDGLHPNEDVLFVTMEPMTNSFPHSHSPHWEEVWLKLPPDSSYVFLGSEVRLQNPNDAFLAPPDGKTWHSVVNLTDKPLHWLYIGHYTEPVVYPNWVYQVPSVRPMSFH